MPNPFKLLLSIFALTFLYASLCFADVPSNISYQGKLLDSAGKPVADGSYSLVFKLYTAESGTSAPVWTSQPVSVSTKGGLFSTTFSPTSDVINNASNLWLETVVGSTALSPRTPLASSAYAIHAGTADTVPDGSITTSKLGSDVEFSPAVYLVGAKSGLPATYKVTISFDGSQGTNPITLAAPFHEDIIYSSSTDTTGWTRVAPSSSTQSSLTIRRKVTSNDNWLTWAIANTTGTSKTTHDVVILLTNDGTEKARWTFNNGLITGYNVRLGDDGLPVEEMTLQFTELMVRDVPQVTKMARPVMTVSQAGFNSGYPASAEYLLKWNGTTYSSFLIGSDIGFINNSSTKKNIIPGYLLWQNPGAIGSVFEWFRKIRSGSFTEETIGVMLNSDSSSISIMQLKNSWPYSYTLMLGDDGLPVEQFKFISEEIATY